MGHRGEHEADVANRFQTTRWSVVLQARGESPGARRALEELCRVYRSPVIAFVRSRGSSSEDAEDLGQAFLTRLVETAFYEQADPARGSFRAFLLTALKRFLADVAEHDRAQKRGGNFQFQSLDILAGESGEGVAAEERESPDHVFERAFAQAALRAAMRQLQAETAAAGKAALFDSLCGFLIERPDEAEYNRVAALLNLRRNTLAVAVHRLRLRLRTLLRDELADTSADDAGLDREMTQLHNSLAVVMSG